jgi:hypothetical protein
MTATLAMRRALAVCLALLPACAAIAASATAALSPPKLYQALLTRPFPDSQLPSGFSSAKVGVQQPNKNGLRYHVVGEVAVSIDGPDPDDGIEFIVFPNHSDAVADLNHASFSGSAKLHIVPGGVPGYAKLPGHMWIGSITGKNALGKTITDGVTLVAIAKGNVIVDAYTDSADNTDSGSVPAALALLRAGLRHVKSAGG